MEKALYEFVSMRNFAGIDLGGRSGARRDLGVREKLRTHSGL